MSIHDTSMIGPFPKWVADKGPRFVGRVGRVIVLLLDPDAPGRTSGQFRNLRAYNDVGEEIWVAEHPTATSQDRYYKIKSWEPLVALSTASYECTIDATTGRLVSATFLK